MESPLRQGAGTGLDWFSVATEASGGETPDLGYFLEVSIFIGIFLKLLRSPTKRSGVPPPQASVATKNQTGPCSGTLPEGGSLTGGHLYHPGALHDEEGVVHPRA